MRPLLVIVALLTAPLPAAATRRVLVKKASTNVRLRTQSSKTLVRGHTIKVQAPSHGVNPVPVKQVKHITTGAAHHATRPTVTRAKIQPLTRFSSFSLLKAALTGPESREIRRRPVARQQVRRRPGQVRVKPRPTAPSLLKMLQYQMDLMQMNESLGQ